MEWKCPNQNLTFNNNIIISDLLNNYRAKMENKVRQASLN